MRNDFFNFTKENHSKTHSKKTGWGYLSSHGQIVPLPHPLKEGEKVGMVLTNAFSKHIESGAIKDRSGKIRF